MDAKKDFADFVARLRAHDEAAANQFVEVYGPVILRVIGHRLSKLGLSRLLDPADIAQQVLAKFFAKVADAFELASPEDVIKLLVVMTNALIVDERRHAEAQRRDCGEQGTDYSHLAQIASAGHESSHDLNEQQQLDEIHKHMSEEEWHFAKEWASGATWSELAAEYSQSAEALRKKLSRLVARVRHDVSPESEIRGVSQ